MTRVTFRAWRGKHYIGVAELLCALGRVIADAYWQLELDEVAPGPQGDALDALPDGPRVGTRDLILAAFPDGQVIDGRLLAFAAPNDAEPLLVLHAVDSSEWDVEAADPAVMAAIREALPDATTVEP
jgi:hypothetical protein